jgi:hypothetical protein
MSAALVAGLFGLGGVALGGAMAVISARWQAASARQGRIAELELQLRHERFMRDETARRSAILEFIAALERLNRAVYAIAMNHDHGEDMATRPASGCSLIDMKELAAAGVNVYELMQRQGALITLAASPGYGQRPMGMHLPHRGCQIFRT